MTVEEIRRLAESLDIGDLVIAQLKTGTLVSGLINRQGPHVYIDLTESAGLFLSGKGGEYSVQELILINRCADQTSPKSRVLTCNEILVKLINDFGDWAAEAHLAAEINEVGVLEAVTERILAVAAEGGRPVSFDVAPH